MIEDEARVRMVLKAVEDGRLTEAEALAIIGSIHGATDLNS